MEETLVTTQTEITTDEIIIHGDVKINEQDVVMKDTDDSTKNEVCHSEDSCGTHELSCIAEVSPEVSEEEKYICTYEVTLSEEKPPTMEPLTEGPPLTDGEIYSDFSPSDEEISCAPRLVQMLSKHAISKKLKCSEKSEQVEKFDYANKSRINCAAATSIIGRRGAMEDTYKIKRINDNLDFYGVFDGHGGWEVAVYIKDELVKQFENEKLLDYNDKDAVIKTIRKICLDVDRTIFGYREWWCGSTAIFAIRFKKSVYVVNIGDSRAVIFDDKNNVHLVTDLHKPDNLDEITRIKKRNVMVYNGRVNGMLAVARSFGDHSYEKYGDPLEGLKTHMYHGFDSVVSAEPTISVFEVPETSNTKYHMVLASDGLWDRCIIKKDNDETPYSYFKFDEIVDMVKTSRSPKEASRKIVDCAYNSGIGDNITVLIVNLPSF